MNWVLGDTQEKFRMIMTQFFKEILRFLEMPTGLCSNAETWCPGFAMNSFRRERARGAKTLLIVESE